MNVIYFNKWKGKNYIYKNMFKYHVHVYDTLLHKTSTEKILKMSTVLNPFAVR